MFNLSNLHAKVYIFDECRCVITSANLTSSGLRRNIECGVLLVDSPSVTKMNDFYEMMTNDRDVGKITNKKIREITTLLERIPPTLRIEYPSLDIEETTDEKIRAITSNLTGWKREVFLRLGQFDDEFTSSETALIAKQLRTRYPRNNYPEAKVRQVLQQLRDLGLVEFVRPGVYRKLWV